MLARQVAPWPAGHAQPALGQRTLTGVDDEVGQVGKEVWRVEHLAHPLFRSPPVAGSCINIYNIISVS